MAKSKRAIVTGIKEIDRALKRLESKVQRKIVRDGIKKALKPMLDEVVDNAPVDSGETKKNIKIRAGKSKPGIVSQEIRVGDKQLGEDFHAQQVEFGTSESPAHPFMGPAFESKGPAAVDDAERLILDGVLKEVKKK